MSRRAAILCALGLAFASPLASPAFAEPSDGSDAGAPAESPRLPGGTPSDRFDPLQLFSRVTELRPRLRLSQNFVIDQEYGDGAAVDTYSSAVRLSVEAPVSRQVGLRFVARIEVDQFDFSGDSNFLQTGRAPDDPFDDAFRNQFRLEGGYRLSPSWALVTGAKLSSAWESGSSYADALQGSGLLGVTYAYHDRFALVVGGRVRSKVAASGVAFSVIVQFRWRINDQLTLASRGMGLKLRYRPWKRLSLFVQGEWRQRSFRLENRGGTIGKGILQNRTAPVVAGVSYKISKHFHVRGWAGAQVYQKYTVRNDDREKVDSVTARGAAFTGRLDVEIRF